MHRLVDDLPPPRPLREALQRRPVQDVHALLGGCHGPELRHPPAGAVRHRRGIPPRRHVDRREGVLKGGAARVRQPRGVQIAQQRAQCARSVGVILPRKHGDLLGKPGEEEFLHMARLPQPQPAVGSRPVPVVQCRLSREPVHRQRLLPGPPDEAVDQQPARRLELFLGLGFEPHPHEIRPPCQQQSLPPRAIAHPGQATRLRTSGRLPQGRYMVVVSHSNRGVEPPCDQPGFAVRTHGNGLAAPGVFVSGPLPRAPGAGAHRGQG